MLILLLDLLRKWLSLADLGPFRVLTFNTVRAGVALALSFIISLAIGPRLIRILRSLKANQPIRKAISATALSLDDLHGGKVGTPTMGGILILIATLVPVLLLCRLNSAHVWLLILMTLGYGLLGFWDDYLKVALNNHKGVSPRGKLLLQALLGLALGLALMMPQWNINYATTGAVGYPYLLVPFFKEIYIPLGWWYVPFVMLVMLSTSNAVNLTDGLDGLAIGVSAANTLAFIIIAYLVSRFDYANYLFVPHIIGGDEIVVFLAALLGASFGFLWFNAHPAQMFMGDTGSMLLGGALGATAVLLKQEYLLIVMGGVFVVEAASVIIQVTCFRLTGTRYFRMSPLHHHFEKRGMHESKIIIRFWIIAMLLAIAGLAMLKLR